MRTDYTTAVELDPKEAYAKRAFFHWTNNDLAKATSDQTKAIEFAPKNNATVMLRAVMYEEVKEYEKAIADMTAAIALIPTFAEYYVKRAELYRKVGRFELASKDEATATELKKH
jgi:tetratricopeptide (TPR) repeat protein